MDFWKVNLDLLKVNVDCLKVNLAVGGMILDAKKVAPDFLTIFLDF